MGPARGALAAGDEGLGRMSEPEEILAAIEDVLSGDLAGRRIVVTAGPTWEPIDPVRFIGNRSTGKMGFAIAAEAFARGADVTLVVGPGTIEPPPGPAVVRVTTADEMRDGRARRVRAGPTRSSWPPPSPTSVPTARADEKLKKEGGPPQIRLVPTPDILAELGASERDLVLVGFAAETQDVEAAGREKLRRKGLDLLVANEVGREGTGFGSDTNRAAIVSADGQDEPLRTWTKPELASAICDRLAKLLSALTAGRPWPADARPSRSWAERTFRRYVERRTDPSEAPAMLAAHMGHAYLFSSESVTEGHPDKLADQISDAVLDAIIAVDPDGRVACETLVTTGLVMVAGEISTSEYIDIPAVVRQTITEIGYTDANFGIDGDTCGVITSIQEQSADIARGVEDSLEHREGHSADELDVLGAGDQGMMFGFACRETDELMPLPIAIAHRLAKRLADVRKAGVIPYLRPDGKSQVTIAYEDARPTHVDTVLISAQHREEVDVETLLAPDVRSEVIDPVLREFELDAEGVRVLVNPTGRFEIGGPEGRHGTHRSEDHRRQLRRDGAARRRLLLGQGPDEGRPLGGVHGPVRREEPRRRGRRRPPPDPGRVRDRHRAPGLAGGRHVRVGAGRPRQGRRRRVGGVRLPARRDHPRPRSPPSDLRGHGGLRALRSQGVPLGGHRPRG